MLFFNIFLGLVSCLVRIILGLVLGVVFMQRLSKSTLPRSYERRDPGECICFHTILLQILQFFIQFLTLRYFLTLWNNKECTRYIRANALRFKKLRGALSRTFSNRPKVFECLWRNQLDVLKVTGAPIFPSIVQSIRIHFTHFHPRLLVLRLILTAWTSTFEPRPPMFCEIVTRRHEKRSQRWFLQKWTR